MMSTTPGAQAGMLVYVPDSERVWVEGDVKTVFGPLCTVAVGEKVKIN